MRKQELRQRYLDKRNALTASEVSAFSEIIREKIKSLPQFKLSSCIAGYMPKDNEVDLRPLFFNNSQNFVFPAVQDESYVLARAINEDEFTIGKFGILEPPLTTIVSPENVDLWLIPGVGFTNDGKRIGFGKGIYDRLLYSSTGTKIGVCFSSQIIEEPFMGDDWDIKMDLILSN